MHCNEHVLLSKYPLVQLRQLVLLVHVLQGGIQAVQLLFVASGKNEEGQVEAQAPLYR